MPASQRLGKLAEGNQVLVLPCMVCELGLQLERAAQMLERLLRTPASASAQARL